MKQQRGFTLIELVMVIVILGVLAAVALPKFVDLRGDAQTAAIQGAAGALSSYSTINYASYQVSATTTNNIRLSGAGAGAALTGSMPGWDTTKFVIVTDGTCGTTVGAAVNATMAYRTAAGTGTVNASPTATALATIICTG